MDNLTVLISLIEQIHRLDEVQEWINGARVAAPKNQTVQRNLNRHQEDVDRKRVLLEMTMADIRSRN